MPSLGLSLGFSSAGSFFGASGAGQQISGFPLRIRAFNGASSINLYKRNQNAEFIEYVSDDELTSAFWDFIENYGEFYIDNDNVSISAPTLASVPTSWPSTGWGEGWQFGVASPTLVTLSYDSPQSFAYSNSIPSIVFNSSPVINANLFTISGLSSENVGTQNAVISLEKADYYLANSVTIPVTITKRNVTLSINNQSSTYSHNTYNWYDAVSISTLTAGDTIQGQFNSDLLTGVPATNANVGSYTISFNPNYTSANYNITNSPASATWTINKANQTITFNPNGTALTTDSTNLSASSTSGLAVSFSVVSGPAALNANGSTLTYTGAGSVVVRASQAGNTNYNAATNVDRTITVSAPQAGGSGIPVATTNNIVLSIDFNDLNATYTKVANPANVFAGGVEGRATGAVYFYAGYTGGDKNGAAIWYGDSPFGDIGQVGWHLTFYNDNVFQVAFLITADSANIPTTGWTMEPGATSTVTITAA